MTTYMLTRLIRRDHMELNWTMVQLNCDVFSAHEPEKNQLLGIMIVKMRLECCSYGWVIIAYIISSVAFKLSSCVNKCRRVKYILKPI